MGVTGLAKENEWLLKPSTIREMAESKAKEPKLYKIADRLKSLSDKVDEENQSGDRGNTLKFEGLVQESEPGLLEEFKSMTKYEQLTIINHAGRNGPLYNLFVEQAGMHIANIGENILGKPVI